MPTQQFINDLLDLPDFAGGNFAEAFDKCFGKRPGINSTLTIGLIKLKEMIAKNMIGKVYHEDVHLKFIDYVSYVNRDHSFTKTKFVAAMQHLAIVNNKQNIIKHFKNKMPGMNNYKGATKGNNVMQTQMMNQYASP